MKPLFNQVKPIGIKNLFSEGDLDETGNITRIIFKIKGRKIFLIQKNRTCYDRAELNIKTVTFVDIIL